MPNQDEKLLSMQSKSNINIAANLIFSLAENDKEKKRHLANFQAAAVLLDDYSKLITYEARDEFKENHASAIHLTELNSIQREAYTQFCKRMFDKDIFHRLDNLNVFSKNPTADVQKIQIVADVLDFVAPSGGAIISAGLTKGVEIASDRKVEQEKRGTDSGIDAVGGENQINYGQVVRMAARALVESCGDLLLMIDDPKDRKEFITYLVDECITNAKIKGHWDHINDPQSLAATMLTSFHAIKGQSRSRTITMGDKSKTINVGKKTIKLENVDTSIKSVLGNQFIKIGDQLYGKGIDSKFVLSGDVSAQVYLRLLAAAREATEAEKQQIEHALIRKKSKLSFSKTVHVESYVPVTEKSVIEAIAQRTASEDELFFKKLNKKRVAEEQMTAGIMDESKHKAKQKESKLVPFLIEGLLQGELESLKGLVAAKKMIAINQATTARKDEVLIKSSMVSELAGELNRLQESISGLQDKKPVTAVVDTLPEKIVPIKNLSSLTSLSAEKLSSLIFAYEVTLNDKKKLALKESDEIQVISANLNMLKNALLVKALDIVPVDVAISNKISQLPSSTGGLFVLENKRLMLVNTVNESKQHLEKLKGKLELVLKRYAEQRSMILAEMDKVMDASRVEKIELALASRRETSGLTERESKIVNLIKMLDRHVESGRNYDEVVNRSLRTISLSNPMLVRSNDDLADSLMRLKALRAEAANVESWVNKDELHAYEVIKHELAVKQESVVESKSSAPPAAIGQKNGLNEIREEVNAQLELVEFSLCSAAGQESEIAKQIISNYSEKTYDRFRQLALRQQYTGNPGSSVEEKKDFAALQEVCQFKMKMQLQRETLQKLLDQKQDDSIHALKNKVEALYQQIHQDISQHAYREISVSKPKGFFSWLKRALGFIKEHPRKTVAFAAITVATGGLAVKMTAIHFVALGTYKIAAGLIGGGAGAVGAKVSAKAVKDMLTSSQAAKQSAEAVMPQKTVDMPMPSSQSFADPLPASEVVNQKVLSPQLSRS